MTGDQYEVALRAAKKDLSEAVAELGEAQARAQELEQRIGDLRQTISVLSNLCGQEDLDLESSLGLTDAIRVAFCGLGQQSVTPQEMRLRLESQGFNTRRYGNLLASIHTVLGRLEKKGEIKQAGTRPDGKVAYAQTQHGANVASATGIATRIASALLNLQATMKPFEVTFEPKVIKRSPPPGGKAEGKEKK
jgi:hypothetical protein